MRGVSVMMIVVVSEVIVMSVVAIMSGIANRVASLVTFSYGASCLCRGQRVMGARLWKPYVV